jgi:hypothetical protein
MQWVLDIWSSVVSQSWGRRTPPSETPKINTLAGLPAELLLSITDFLPLNDRIRSSLCGRRFFTIFNHRTNPARPLGKDKLPILRRLERDLPKYFVCYICLVLHKYARSECFGLSSSVYDQDECPLPCIQKWKRQRSDLELRYQASLHVHRI